MKIHRRVCLISAALLPLAVSLYGQGRNYGRSMVITQQGIAATSQTLASSAAAQILAQGGSAVDAAIAANTVLAVVEPMKTGLGGDLFVIYWEAGTGKLVGLNASGTAPKALSPEFLAKQGIKSMPAYGIHSFTVPGAVEGWAQDPSALRQAPVEGSVPIRDRLRRTRLSRDRGDSGILGRHRKPVCKVHPESVRVFLPGGKVPKVGDRFQESRYRRAPCA